MCGKHEIDNAGTRNTASSLEDVVNVLVFPSLCGLLCRDLARMSCLARGDATFQTIGKGSVFGSSCIAFLCEYCRRNGLSTVAQNEKSLKMVPRAENAVCTISQRLRNPRLLDRKQALTTALTNLLFRKVRVQYRAANELTQSGPRWSEGQGRSRSGYAPPLGQRKEDPWDISLP